MFDDNLHHRRWPDGHPVGAVPDSPADLDSDEDDTVPPRWDEFDTLLRRIFMVSLILAVWLMIFFGVIFSSIELAEPAFPPVVDVYPSHAPSLLCDEANC